MCGGWLHKQRKASIGEGGHLSTDDPSAGVYHKKIDKMAINFFQQNKFDDSFAKV